MAKNSIIIKVLASILVGTFLLQDLVWANPDLSSGPAQHTTLQVQSVFNPIDQQVRLKAVVETLLTEIVRSLPNIDTIHLLLTPKLSPPNHNLKPELDFAGNIRSTAGNRIIPCRITDTSTGASLKLFYELVPGADGKVLPLEVRADDWQKSVAENAGAAVQPLAVPAIPEEYAKLEHTLGTLEGQLYSARTMLNPKMAGKAHRLVKYIIRECDRIIDYEDRLHPKDKTRTTFHIALKAKDIKFEAILLSADIAKIRRGNFIKHTIIVIGIVAIAALLIWGGHYIVDYVKSLLRWIKEQNMQNIKFSEICGYRILLGSASVATGAAALLNSYPDATILEDGFLSEDTDTTVLQLMELLKQPSDKEARIRKKVYLRCIPKTRKEYDVAACIGFQDIVSQKTIVQAIRRGIVSATQGKASENRSHVFEIELRNPIKMNTGEVISKITFESYSPSASVAFSEAISGASECDADTEKIAKLMEKPFTVVPVGLPMAIVDESGIASLARHLEVDQAQLRALLITQDEIDEAINKTAAAVADEKARIEAQRALEAFLKRIEEDRKSVV